MAETLVFQLAFRGPTEVLVIDHAEKPSGK